MGQNEPSKKQKVSNTGLRRLIGLTSDSWLPSFVDDHLVRTRESRRDPGWFHPSELSTPCDRRLAFSYLGVPQQEDTIGPQTLRIFHNGDSVHRRWQSYFRAMGILVSKEAPFEVPTPPIRGKADAIIRHPVSSDLSIVEIKSINANGFDRLSGPREDHFNQANAYMGGHHIDTGHVLYENKNTQQVRVFPIKFDQVKWEQVQFRLMKIMRKLIKREMPEPFILPDNGCTRCPYFAICPTFPNDLNEYRNDD